MVFPLPLLPKANHVPSSPWTMLGSGKSECSASRGARFWMGEASTVIGMRVRHSNAAGNSLENILGGVNWPGTDGTEDRGQRTGREEDREEKAQLERETGR